MSTTTIEWTDETWNPTTGCDRVSPGCDNCYALTMAKRLKAMGSAKYQTDGDPLTSGPGFGIAMHPDTVTAPFGWARPRKVFVNSMSDLFHKDVTDEFIAVVFSVMARTPQHTYQILTKRHGRMRSLLNRPSFRDNLAHLAPWPLPNVWLGVSVEDQQRADLRVPALVHTPAAVRFLSCEPLLGPINLASSLRNANVQWGHGGRHRGTGTKECPRESHHHHDERCWFPLDWVIAGGESGPGYRAVDADWIRSLRDQCNASRVAFLFKQWGGRTPKASGRELDGRTWDEYPESAA